MNDYLILKLSDKEKRIPFNNEKELINRANGSWRITPQKVKNTKYALLLFRGQVIGEYTIGPTIIYDRENTRTTFDMKPYNVSKYRGLYLNYKTANPASIVSQKKLDSMIQK